MLRWDELRYVLAVSTAGTLAEAARSLKVDKATVSRRVAALERSLGVRLFERHPDGYRLTAHGERALAAVTEIDRVAASLEVELSEAGGDGGGVVHLTVPQFFATKVLFPGLASFRRAHPKIELLVNASSSVLNVAQRQAEVGLRNLKPEQKSVTVRRVGFLRSAVYASRAYLEERGTPREARDLATHALLGWDRAFTFVPTYRWIGELGAPVVLRVNDAAVLCDAAAEGLGVAVLPCILGDERSGLVRLDAFGHARDAIFAVAPGELRHTVRVRAVIDLLCELWGRNETRLGGT